MENITSFASDPNIVWIIGAFLTAFAVMRINTYLNEQRIKSAAKKEAEAKAKAEAAENLEDLLEEEHENRFILRRVSDWWTPAIFTIIYLIVNAVVIYIPTTLEAISGIQAMLFKLLQLSFALPIARLLILIFIPIMDNYTDKKQALDFNEMSPSQRIWVYIALILSFVYSVVN